MVKKVQYELIDNNILPADLICKGNAYNELVGIDDSFIDEWTNITTKLTDSMSIITKDIPTDVKANLYLSYINNCGLILVEDSLNCSCSNNKCKC